MSIAFSNEVVTSPEEEEADRIATEEHFENLYTDEAALSATEQDPNYKQAERYSGEDPKDFRYSTLNYAYLSTLVGRDLSETEYSLVRDQYSEENFGARSINDQEFAKGVTGQFETKQKRRLASTELYTGAIKQALDDELNGTSTSAVEAFAKWRDKNKEVLSPDEEFEMFVKGVTIGRQAREDIRSVAPAAARVWQSLTKYDEGEASEEDVRALGAELVAMGKPARDKVYAYAILAAQASGEDLGNIEQAAKNLGQSISRGFGFMEDIRANTYLDANGKQLPFGIISENRVPAPPTLGMVERQVQVRLMQLERQPDTPAKAEEIARLNQTMEMTQVVRELKEVAKHGIDPNKPIAPEGILRTAEKGVYAAGGSIGYMVATAINPMLGVAAVYPDEYDQLRLKNPNMNPHAAAAAALASSSIQTAIEMAQIRTFGGIGLALRNIKSGVLAAAAKVGVGLAKENVQEAIQDAVSDGIPLVMSHLRDDMPDQDTHEIMKSYVKERGEVFFSMLAIAPFGIGASRMSNNDMMVDRSLAYLGFDNKQRAAIMTARDPKAAYSSEIGNRTEANIQKGIKLQEADLGNAQATQQNPDLPTFEDTTLPDGTHEYRVVREPPAEQAPQYLTPAEMKGKTVELQTVDTKTGTVQTQTLNAEVAQATTKRNIDNYSTLIDCLLR